jgi:hypothetical protein
MNDHKLMPFHYEHLKLMDMREYEKVHIYPYLTQSFLDYCSTNMYNYTAIKDGRIITCVGFLPLWEGVFDVWQIPSVHVEDHVLEYAKTMRRYICDIAKELKAHRIQSSCPANELHDRWMEFLGFKCEGTMAKYNRFKIDYRIWSRIWEQMPAQQ